MSALLVRGERPGLTRAEQWLRGAAAGLALTSAGFAVWYAAKGIFTASEYPYAANSVAKDLLLMGLSLLVFWDVRRWAAIAVPLIVLVHVAMPVIMLVVGTGNGFDHTWIGPPDTAEAFRNGWLAADVLVAVAFVWLHRSAARARYDLRYLPPSAFRALMALAEVLVLRKDPVVRPAEVAVRVDRYLAGFRARRKWVIRLALVALAYWPLVTLRPPFHVMSVELRERWIRRRFFDEVADRLVPEWLRSLRQTALLTAQQFCYMGYYGDGEAAERAGYVPFSRRPGYEDAMKRVDRGRRGVRCMAPGDIPGEELTADVLIVGTGAGGATLAYELARRGREVLMVERGSHVPPSDFTEDEAEQLSKLYADGALNFSTDFHFRVAQGMCVGGSTVVNNAVCFNLPPHVLERWNDPGGLNAGLDEERVWEAFRSVRKLMKVASVGPPEILNPGAFRIIKGLEHTARRPFELVECNIADCLGSGYCNIGCAYGKKLSALDWTLPRAQEDFGDAVRILPDCRVEKVLVRDKRAYGVRARLEDGRRLTVRANTVVLSAGAIASSLILQRSGLGGELAGRGLAFNMGSPVTFDFADVLHSERGMQISHFMRPTDGTDDGLVFESWFNPIVAQSLFMPGWFEEHWDNMRRYKRMTCLGTVVGTESNGSVKAARLLGGVQLDYVPSNEDFVRMKNGVRLACELGLEAGAERVMPATFRAMNITSRRELSRIDDELGDASDLSVNSVHPQGGNAMSADPVRGVVDPSFRVYGTLGLHVCDASVFPSSITVNPQLTVMALAAYAADEIGGPAPPRPASERARSASAKSPTASASATASAASSADRAGSRSRSARA
jgi:choline dehydrogenase-like flavoprotein